MKEQVLTAIVQDAAQKSKSGMKVIAAELDKKPSTLYQQLNPYDDKGRLGLEDAHIIMKSENDLSLVRAMALDMNHTLFPLGKLTPDKATLVEEIVDDFKPLVDMHESMKDGEEPTTVEKLMEDHINEVRETFSKYLESKGR